MFGKGAVDPQHVGSSRASVEGAAFSQLQSNLWSQRSNYFRSLNQRELKITVNY